MKKTIVEDCLMLDVNKLNKDRLFHKGQAWRGTVEWSGGSSIGYEGHPDHDGRYDLLIILSYRFQEEDIKIPVPIVSTPCHVGGKRFWFLCPGARCLRRVGKLYKPLDRRLFLCRHCHDLSYESRQSWDSRCEANILGDALEIAGILDPRSGSTPKQQFRQASRVLRYLFKKGMK